MMGQRLTIDILNNGVRVALIYYHWSAYFDSTICELKYVKDDILKTAREKKDFILKDILLGIIEGLESRGGGLCIDPPTRVIANELWPGRNFKYDINRNDGLLALSEEDINRMYGMTEGTAGIDILTDEVWTNVDLEYGYHFKKEMFEVDPFKVMTFEQLDGVYDTIEKLYEKMREERK